MADVGVCYNAVIGNYKQYDNIIGYFGDKELNVKNILIGGNDRIFPKFISIDISNPIDILKFYNQYGFIGTRSHFGDFCFLEPEYQSKTRYLIGERISDVENHIKLLKTIVWIKEELNSCNEFDKLLQNYQNAYEFVKLMNRDLEDSEDILFDLTNCYCFDFFHNEITIDELKTELPTNELKNECINIQMEIMNYFLRFVHPSITDNLYPPQIGCHWMASTLLAAMYFEVFLMINEGKSIRRCANKTCNNYFEVIGNDTRKIYCSARCAQLEAKRNQRRREKERTSALNGQHSENRE